MILKEDQFYSYMIHFVKRLTGNDPDLGLKFREIREKILENLKIFILSTFLRMHIFYIWLEQQS